MAGNDQRDSSVGAHQVGASGLPGSASALELTRTWQSALQQLYKQQAEIPQSAFFPAGVMAAQHPYAQLWASQPALMYGAHMFGGVNPYGFLPGMAQNQAAAGGASGRTGASGPPANGVAAVGSNAGENGAVRKLPPRLPPGGPQASQPTQQPQVESQAEPRRKRRKQEMPRGGVERTVGEEAESSSRSSTPTPSSGDMSQQQALSRGLSGGIEAMSGEPSAGGRGTQGVSGVSGASDWRRQRATVSSGGADGDLGSGAGIQDEREVKKLRRKQSNRESARRSRLRKQAECEALTGKVKDLQQENGKLKTANKLLEDRVQELTRLLEQRPADQLANGESDVALCGGKKLSQPQNGLPANLSLASQPSTQGTESKFTAADGALPTKEGAIVGV